MSPLLSPAVPCCPYWVTIWQPLLSLMEQNLAASVQGTLFARDHAPATPILLGLGTSPSFGVGAIPVPVPSPRSSVVPPPGAVSPLSRCGALSCVTGPRPLSPSLAACPSFLLGTLCVPCTQSPSHILGSVPARSHCAVSPRVAVSPGVALSPCPFSVPPGVAVSPCHAPTRGAVPMPVHCPHARSVSPRVAVSPCPCRVPRRGSVPVSPQGTTRPTT